MGVPCSLGVVGWVEGRLGSGCLAGGGWAVESRRGGLGENGSWLEEDEEDRVWWLGKVSLRGTGVKRPSSEASEREERDRE